jgi:signal transduction histidine kinase
MQAIPVEEVIGLAVEQVLPLAAEKNIVIDWSPNGPLTRVWADFQRLRQVLTNLLGNAVKYSDHGTCVTVWTEERERMLAVFVADQGVGIDSEFHGVIFEPFRRVNGFSHRSCSGSGLGLAIVKQIVEEHGGSVWIESELRKGSTFSFTVPLTGG